MSMLVFHAVAIAHAGIFRLAPDYHAAARADAPAFMPMRAPSSMLQDYAAPIQRRADRYKVFLLHAGDARRDVLLAIYRFMPLRYFCAPKMLSLSRRQRATVYIMPVSLQHVDAETTGARWRTQRESRAINASMTRRLRAPPERRSSQEIC